MLIGIDIGTSAAKGVLLDPEDGIRAAAAREYPVLRPRPGWSEQEPSAWWDAVVRVSRDLLASAGIDGTAVGGIGVSGQMHGSVFLGRDELARAGSARLGAVRPALLWNDQRTAAQCAHIESTLGGREACVRAVGNAALTGFTLPKLLWLREHEPENFARLARLVNPKDSITLHLTGEPATDVGDASGTLLFNPSTRSWSAAALEAFDLDPGLLPPVRESAQPVGRLTRWAAGEMGLAPGTTVVAGSGDNQCGAVGAGIVAPGMVLATLGTSGVIYAHADEPRLDLPTDGGSPAGRVHTMCAAAGPASWCNTGCTLSAAGALHWARDVLAPGTPFDTLLAEAAEVPAGCEGLLFAPHLTGERCPYPDPKARGAWVGLTVRHTRAHMVRAVLEGVTCTMASMLDIVRGLPVRVGRVRLGGGGNKSALWRQMQADFYGVPVELPTAEEGPAFGAALLAGVGSGVWRDAAEACGATIEIGETRDPSAGGGRSAPIRDAHAGLYPRLRDTFGTLSRLAEPTD